MSFHVYITAPGCYDAHHVFEFGVYEDAKVAALFMSKAYEVQHVTVIRCATSDDPSTPTLAYFHEGTRVDDNGTSHADAELALFGNPSSPVVQESAKPVCSVCNDTHRVSFVDEDRGEDRTWMCTSCPVPCRQCANGGGRGPFCEKTPCPCECHKPWSHS